MEKDAIEQMDEWRGLHNEVVAVIRAIPADQWRDLCQDEQWPLNVTAYHIAAGYDRVLHWIELILAGQPLTQKMGDIDAENTDHVQRGAQCGQAEVLDLLQDGAAALDAMYRNLDDAQRRRTVPMALLNGSPVTPAFMINPVLRNHTQGHLDSIKQTVQRTT